MVQALAPRWRWLFGVLLASLALGCADKSNHSAAASGGSSSGHELPNADACVTPQQGCECENEGEVVECGSVERRSGDYVSCSMGERVCEDGKWSACEGDKVVQIAQPGPEERAAQALGNSQACIDNPCDPFCQVVVDDSTNLDVGDGGLTVTDDGITLTAVPPDPMANTCTDIVLDPPTQTLTVTQINQTQGLTAEFFNQRDNAVTQIPGSWTVTSQRTDASVNFDWAYDGPGMPGIGADNFTVRWSGYVIPTYSENYTFYTYTDDGVRLWVNGALVIDHWIDQGPTQYSSAPIALTAGTAVPIRMEYFEHGGAAIAQLKWSSASIPSATVIPEANLSPTMVPMSSVVTSPANATLSVGVVPPTCYDGVVTAAWGLDTLDRATVNNGVITLLSPIAGPMQVSAYVQEFSDTATVNVVVDVTDTNQAPAGAAAIFAGASSGPDTTTILYPYDATVFPLALKPPVLQWDTGGVAASAIKVTLSYPINSPAFSWSKIVPAPSNGRFTFTREQWGYFERTAKGGTGKITLQRIVGGALKDPVSKTVVFSSAPLRGKIFYTQYGGGQKIMRLDPSSDTPAVNAFPSDDGCPVCHSMSANGAKFATSNWTWSAVNGGISNVDAAGNLTRLSDFQNPSGGYSASSSDWRGFAWAPLTPDGNYILVGNNIYGNTNQTVVGIDTTTRQVSLPNATLSGGRGIGLQADYYANTTLSGSSWQRIDAHPDFNWAGSPGGPIPADGFSVSWTGEIEPYFTETVTFSVETTAGVTLAIGGNTIINQTANSANNTFTGTANLTRGVKTSIKLTAVDKNSTTKVRLFWSGAMTPNELVPQSQLFPAGGQRGALVTYQDNAGHGPVTRLESDMAYDWGSGQPVKGSSVASQNINADNFTTVWDALVEMPVTTNVNWCINSDDGYTVTINGVQVLTGAAWTNNAYVCSAGTTAVTAGQKVAVHVAHSDGTGGARMKLGWKMASFITTVEDIPMARTYPPASFTVPANGLSATFYDTMDFGGASVPQNATTPQAYATYVPNLDYDWGGDRISYGRALTSSDTMSGRFTGRLIPACTGVHEFEIVGDDTSEVWIGNERISHQTSWGTRYAAMWLDAATTYDFKVDWTENGGGSGMRINWKPACSGALTYTAIPTTNFLPTGDTTLNGYLRKGGDNGNGVSYWMWQTPNAVGQAATDVTTQSPGNWGLGRTTMMVPTFSPDGTKLAFVDGDMATGAGWRKGLSTLEFDQASKVFRRRKQVVNNYPFGNVIKWPTFESDSKSIIYQAGAPGEFCCRGSWTNYGYMAPTNYFEDPGLLRSVDSTAASPTPVSLDKLNNGERAVDRNKAYQATMLPTPAGGYRWAVFTSTRPYGNTINLPAVQQDYSNLNSYTPMLNTSELQSMLWVSAIDDQTSANADRSHPAFFLPNQAYSESGAHYLNERAYWVAESCRAAGSGAGSTCDVDEDCCGGTASPKTAVCRIDTPITQPPTRHCAAVPPPNACIAADGACSASTDCCFNYPCVNNICVQPPPLPTYPPDNFERLYTAECGEGTLPVWRFFDWQAETPSNSQIEIYAESVDDPADLHSLPAAPAAVNITGVVYIATVSGATVAGWVGQDIGAKLDAAGVPQRKYLLITMRLVPSTNKTYPPVISDWRQSYSCPPQE